LKIAFLSVFPPFRGGISQFSTSLFEALKKEHEIVAFNFKRQYPAFLFPGKSQYINHSKESDFKSIQLLDSVNPITYKSTTKAINAFKPDLLLSNFWLPYLGPGLSYVCKNVQPNCKKIGIMHNVIPHEKRPFDAYFTRQYIKRQDGFVVMSSHVKNNLLKEKKDADYIVRPHPFYNHFGDKIERKKALQKMGIPNGKKVLLFFGFIRKYKGLEKLIEAMSLLNSDYHLIIAGESYDDFSLYQKKIDTHEGLSGRIHVFNQFIPESEVKDFFSAADVVVLPYITATQSGITAIAYHFNIPVIASDVGGLKDYVINDETGHLLKNQTIPELVDAIQHFFDEKKDYSQGIKKLIMENSWSLFGKEILSLANKMKA